MSFSKFFVFHRFFNQKLPSIFRVKTKFLHKSKIRWDLNPRSLGSNISHTGNLPPPILLLYYVVGDPVLKKCKEAPKNVKRDASEVEKFGGGGIF